MRPPLDKKEDELCSGKLAGQYLTAAPHKRPEVLLSVPQHLLIRVNEIIDSYEKTEGVNTAKKIARIPRVIDRRIALNKVAQNSRFRIKHLVEHIFRTRARG